MEPAFEVGRTYTRREVQEIARVPAGQRGGNWDTGYTRYSGAIYVFCNVGVPGRTGHDYPNRWVGKELHWSAKNRSRLDHPSVQALIAGDAPVHVFWRDYDRNPFYYAGVGPVVAVRDSSPVRVVWRF